MARSNKTWKADAENAALAAELHRMLAISHRQAKGLIDASCVKVNGEVATAYGLRLKTGDEIAVQFDDATVYKELPRPKRSAGGSFTVLFEDQHLLFVNKPAGLLTVPAEKGGEANLAEAITDSYRRRGFKRFDLFIVHRLDRFTSGVLVFGKTPEALHGLKAMFEEHKLQRVYKAILVGELPENSGTMAGHLVEHSKSLRMSVDKRGDRKGAKQAITHYRVLERLPGHTVVEVKLETGRRNQIRVQFADKGYPLLGDQVYGQESELIDRQALHAELLGFRHPAEERNVTISAPLPPDMEAALKALRTASRVRRAAEGLQGEEGIFKPKITKGRKLDRIARSKIHTKPEPSVPSGTAPQRPAPEDRSRGPMGRARGPQREERPGPRAVGSGKPRGARGDRPAAAKDRPPARSQNAGPKGARPALRNAASRSRPDAEAGTTPRKKPFRPDAPKKKTRG